MAEARNIGRRGLVAGAGALALSTALPGGAEAGLGLRPKLRPTLDAGGPPSLQAILGGLPAGSQGGAVVIDAASGRVLEAHNGGIELPPGSMQKTITSLYALERLGGDRRLATRVMGTAPVKGGVLEGDLWLVGGGDPTLDTDRLGDMVAALRKAGLRKVTGRLYYDASVLPDLTEIAPGQPVDAGYNPGVAGLELNYDRVYFKWTAGARQVDMLAQGMRYKVPVHVLTMRAVARNGPVYARADRGGVEVWTVAKQVLGRGGGRWLPVGHVARYVADVFHGLCAQQGIALPVAERGVVPAGAVELVGQQSDPVSDILKEMLKYSTNVTAETLGLLSSGAASLPVSARAMQEWAKVRLGLDARFVNHSGLAAGARVAPLNFARAMRAGVATPSGAALPGLMRKEPLLDAEGRRIGNSGVVTHVKSGTLDFVSALTGFIEPPNGRRMIFCIQSADLARRARITAAEADNPPGLRHWLLRTHIVQGDLVRRWSEVYGGAA